MKQNSYLKGRVCLDCGQPCSDYAIRCKTCSNRLKTPPGIKNPNWKGGLHFYQGYAWIYKPNHPYRQFNGDIKRSRLVVEEHAGRYLSPHEYVHHKNGNKLDDKIGNLEIMTNGEHISHHNKLIGCRNPYRDEGGRFAKKTNLLF